MERQRATMEGLHAEASLAYQQVSRDSPLSNNKPDRSAMGEDAFRHAYASARASQEYGEPVANFLGRGVEWMAAATRENDSAGQNAKDIGMDLHNNRVGREIAREVGPNASSQDLREAIERAADQGRLVLSTQDPRAQQEFDKQVDMKALSAVYDAGTKTRDAVAEGVQSARDLVDDARSKVMEASDKMMEGKDKLFEALKDAFKEAVEKAPDSGFFKFSEAQLESGEAVARSPESAEASAALESVVAVRDSWEMPAAEFEGLASSKEGASRSVLDDPSIQERVADASAEQEREMELEANMDA